MAALTAAFDAAYLAEIIAAPLPQYSKGRKGGRAELALVGERGIEQINLPGGGSFLTPDEPTLIFLPKGADVIPNDELINFNGRTTGQRMSDNLGIIRKLNDVEKAIKNQRGTKVIIRDKGNIDLDYLRRNIRND